MRKDKTMDFVVVSIFAAPFICTGMAFLMQIAEKKIKAVLAGKAKTAEQYDQNISSSALLGRPISFDTASRGLCPL